MVADELDATVLTDSQSADNPTTAAWPFDDSDADLIIRSSDGVQFHVLRKIMSIASPNFKSRIQALPSILDGTPILEIPTPSATLDHVLRFCYPVEPPAYSSIEEFEPVLKLALAYELKLAIIILTERLRTNLNGLTWDALAVYACACRLSLTEEKRLAMHLLRGRSPEDLDNAMFDDIPATDYINLLRYNRNPWCDSFDADNAVQEGAVSVPAIRPAHHPFDDVNADVILRSSDNVDFRVHKLILSLSSPFFRDMFTLPQAPLADAKDDPTDRPVVHMMEDHVTLDDILRLCYPLTSLTSIKNFDRVYSALSAGMKYDMLPVVELLRPLLRGCAKANPGGVYAIARSLALDDLALAAAKLALEKSLPELEVSPQWRHVFAGEFRRLQHYHAACGASAADVTACSIGQAPSWSSQSTQRWMYHDCICGFTKKHRKKLLSTASGWEDCMSKTADQLRIRPASPASVTTLASLWNSVIDTESFNCVACRSSLPTCLAEMQTFCTEMTAEIQRRLDRIPFPPDTSSTQMAREPRRYYRY